MSIPTVEGLKRAIRIKKQILKLESKLRLVLGSNSMALPSEGLEKQGKKRRTMSPAVREKIAAAARARWAKIRRARA